MIKFFRRFRQSLLSENKFTKYLLYAIGEILLVVIGILIALQINNWNEKRLQHEQLVSVYERVLVDIEDDVGELTAALEYYEGIEYIFKRVINDSITPDLFDVGLSRIITRSPTTSLNTTGVNQLKELNVKDSLSVRIIDLYDNMKVRIVDKSEIVISNSSRELVNKFRDNYDWYPEWMSKTIMQNNSSKELQDYFLNSREYRHRVIDNYQIIYVNYLRHLRNATRILNEISEELAQKLEKH